MEYQNNSAKHPRKFTIVKQEALRILKITKTMESSLTPKKSSRIGG